MPTLMFAFGMSGLTARGTSLLMMIPTAVSGTAGNLRRDNVDLFAAAAAVGVAACATTAVGAWVATLLAPHAAKCALRRLPRVHRHPDSRASRPESEGLSSGAATQGELSLA
ncbi:TSUP family transporter [Microbacterium sp. LWH3-1.2]